MRRFLAVLAVVVVLPAIVALGAGAGCGPFDTQEIWVCLNPITGKEDPSTYDANHYVNGVFDPCHCYDPCGPSKACPDLVDAGPPPSGCPASDGGTGSDGGT